LDGFFFLVMLMGVVMDGTAGAAKDSVYLLEFGFKWNGQALHAGRGPLYGTEAPMDDRHPGSEPKGTEVYDLSPFPIRYPKQLQATQPSFSIGFEPAQPIQKGTLHIGVRLVSSPGALEQWLKNGVRDSKDDLAEWTPRLAGPKPKTIEFEIRKRSRTFKDSGAVMEESSLGRYKLAPGSPTDIALEIPDLQASEERYEIVFPDYGFSWERRKSQSPLQWLKGGPVPAPGAAPAGAKPGPENTPKAKASKPPFWQFWKRGE
jgi:hypothetical protein